MMDYLCAKFGDCIFSRFGFTVRANTHRITDAAKLLTRKTFVGVSNKYIFSCILTSKKQQFDIMCLMWISSTHLVSSEQDSHWDGWWICFNLEQSNFAPTLLHCWMSIQKETASKNLSSKLFSLWPGLFPLTTEVLTFYGGFEIWASSLLKGSVQLMLHEHKIYKYKLADTAAAVM